MSRESSSIQKLPPDVINRVAAGEVVQRPCAALKELLENALDAKATSIQVSALAGGMDALQVSDDGTGVHRADLPLLCERYATSKMRTFEDLQSIASFGFRGEALASLSYVSRVTVMTRRRMAAGEQEDSQQQQEQQPTSGLAWRCQYMDGKLTSEPQPCAGNYGTNIRAEKLFYNATVRRTALRPAEEWSRLVDVVTRYALAFPEVGFSCQKEDNNNNSGCGGVCFPKQTTTLRNLKLSHGAQVASHMRFVYYYNPLHLPSPAEGAAAAAASLAEVKEEEEDGNSIQKRGEPPLTKESAQLASIAKVRAASAVVRSLVGPPSEGAFTVMGYSSDSTLLSRRHYLCLFINNRLVENTNIRRAVDAVYSSVLTGGNRPTTVLLITVPAHRLDVNVHPTKKEVCLLDEDAVLARVAEVIRAAILEAASEKQLDRVALSRTVTMALQADVRYGEHRSSNAQDTATGDGGATMSARSSAHAVLSSLHQQSQSGTLLMTTTAPVATPGIVVAPCTMVRVEPQKGAMDVFLKRSAAAAGSDAPSLVKREEEQLDITQEDNNISAAETSEEKLSLQAAPDWSSILSSVTGGHSSSNCKEDAHDDDEEEDEDMMLDFKRFKAEASSATQGGPAAADTSMQPGASLAGTFYGEQQSTTTTTLESATDKGSSNINTSSSDVLLPVAVPQDQQLTSVHRIVEGFHRASSQQAQCFVESLQLVGAADSDSVLMQSGTSLVLVAVLPMVREAVFQQVFLRWAQPALPAPAQVRLEAPVAVAEAIIFAMQHDVHGMSTWPLSESFVNLVRTQAASSGCEEARKTVLSSLLLPATTTSATSGLRKESVSSRIELLSAVRDVLFPNNGGRNRQELVSSDNNTNSSSGCSDGVRRYVRRLVRRLAAWRAMLADYFHICLSEDGQYLLGLPCGIGPGWPPSTRAIPLFLWLLADAVPFPSSSSSPQTPSASSNTCDGMHNGNVTGEDQHELDIQCEMACFTSVARHIAEVLYGLTIPPAAAPQQSSPPSSPSPLPDLGTTLAHLRSLVQHALLPALKNKRLFVPPAAMLAEGHMHTIVTVESLYKVFERC